MKVLFLFSLVFIYSCKNNIEVRDFWFNYDSFYNDFVNNDQISMQPLMKLSNSGKFINDKKYFKVENLFCDNKLSGYLSIEDSQIYFLYNKIEYKLLNPINDSVVINVKNNENVVIKFVSLCIFKNDSGQIDSFKIYSYDFRKGNITLYSFELFFNDFDLVFQSCDALYNYNWNYILVNDYNLIKKDGGLRCYYNYISQQVSTLVNYYPCIERKINNSYIKKFPYKSSSPSDKNSPQIECRDYGGVLAP